MTWFKTSEPGYIKVSFETIYSRYPDIDKSIIAHIEKWRDSVEIGFTTTVDRMLSCSDECGCPSGGRSVKCKGSGHGLPVELVLDHLLVRKSVANVEVDTCFSPYQIVRTL